MLKFVRTKNFKMPGFRRMLDIKVQRDEIGNLIQREQWEESVVIATSKEAEPTKVAVPYNKTYTTSIDRPRGIMTIVEEIDSLYCPSDNMMTIGEVEPKLPSTTPIKSLNEIPVILGAIPVKGTVYDTLYRPRTRTPYNLSSLTNLYKERPPLKVATSVPILPGGAPESYLDIKKRAIGIMNDHLGKGYGEVDHETLLNSTYSVKEFAKIVDENHRQNDTRTKRRAVVPFAHKVELSKSVRLTTR